VQNEIYPIVGIAFEGHKLQLLALLTFLEVERRSEALGERSNIAEKGKRDVKNLESAVNYEARGTSSSRRNRKPRGVSSCVMKPRINSGNVRGLNKRRKRLRISNLLRDWKADVSCFQETMLKSLVVFCAAYGDATILTGVL
jgi:hypothetical protein